MFHLTTAADLTTAANQARDTWIKRAASVGRDETPDSINFRLHGGNYRADFSKRNIKIFVVAIHANGNRRDTRVV